MNCASIPQEISLLVVRMIVCLYLRPCIHAIGRVVVYCLYNDDTNVFSYSRAVKCVALDPLYARKKERPICSGGLAGQLIMNKKGAQSMS